MLHLPIMPNALHLTMAIYRFISHILTTTIHNVALDNCIHKSQMFHCISQIMIYKFLYFNVIEANDNYPSVWPIRTN